jgi:hypothetical protein
MLCEVGNKGFHHINGHSLPRCDLTLGRRAENKGSFIEESSSNMTMYMDYQ